MTVIPDDVATSLGRPLSGSTEEAQINMWIADARTLIRARLGDLDALDQDVLDYVVREAVVARASRPRASSRTVSVDDASVTERFDTAEVSISDEWWDLLSPATQSRAFSTRPSSQADYCGPYSRWGAPR